MSKRVLQPVWPSLFIRKAARAQATSTQEVNSGLESNFSRYSTTWEVSLLRPV
mgnify:CR=1 FL=1